MFQNFGLSQNFQGDCSKNVGEDRCLDSNFWACDQTLPARYNSIGSKAFDRYHSPPSEITKKSLSPCPLKFLLIRLTIC